MSMSSDGRTGYGSLVPVSVLMYRDVATAGSVEGLSAGSISLPEVGAQPQGLSEEEVEKLLVDARVEAAAETEERLRSELEISRAEQAAKIQQALALFAIERQDYFARVESAVVHLALAIAAKILHREAQVDPMLVAALVRVAVEKLHDGSRVSVHVANGEAERWRESLANPLNGCTVEIVEDPHMSEGDCVLQTDLGSANFSMDAQLKEVEQGFCDLLAQRPPIK
ncbi:MAG TPA: FliH/SctL family protein [Acidobacteriaceae bacterium]